MMRIVRRMRKRMIRVPAKRRRMRRFRLSWWWLHSFVVMMCRLYLVVVSSLDEREERVKKCVEYL